MYDMIEIFFIFRTLFYVIKEYLTSGGDKDLDEGSGTRLGDLLLDLDTRYASIGGAG